MRNDVADNDSKAAAEAAHCLALCRQRTGKDHLPNNLRVQRLSSLLRAQVKCRAVYSGTPLKRTTWCNRICPL